MALSQFTLAGFAGKKLVVYENKILGAKNVVVLIHGMQEHAKRYEAFASALASSGIAFFTADLRGHGENIFSKPGLDDGNIYTNIVEDFKIFISYVKENYKGAKITLMGHSYGSFVTQRFVRDYENIVDKFVICGSNYMNNLLIKSARVIAFFNRLFKGRESDANFIEKLSIKGYGKNYEGGNWLSRDDKVFNKYKKDPLCGGTFPVAFYEAMFAETPKNYRGLKKWAKCGKPIFIISGDDDPVCGKNGSGAIKLNNVYKKAGLNSKLKLYKGARHELLNETCKKEVICDIINFING